MPDREPNRATNSSDGGASPQTDEQLMLACEQGDTGAFSTLFARYKQSVFGFFRRRVTDPALAEELTQETFIAVLRAKDHYQPAALFRTYLYAIAYKILRTWRRKAFFRSGFIRNLSLNEEPSSEPSMETDVLMRQAHAGPE